MCIYTSIYTILYACSDELLHKSRGVSLGAATTWLFTNVRFVIVFLFFIFVCAHIAFQEHTELYFYFY